MSSAHDVMVSLGSVLVLLAISMAANAVGDLPEMTVTRLVNAARRSMYS
jgi:hypothetical protein